jgi:hypothetical protein
LSLPFHKIGFFDWIVPGARQRKLNEAESINRQRRSDADKRFQNDHAQWNKQCENIGKQNEIALANHEKAKAAWLVAKKLFYENQERFNLEVDELEKQLFEAVERGLEKILCRSAGPI